MRCPEADNPKKTILFWIIIQKSLNFFGLDKILYYLCTSIYGHRCLYIIDYVEESDGAFRAFELKWNPKKANVAIPASFMQTYPVAEAVVITPENYLDYL